MSRTKIQTEIDPTGARCLITGANGFVGSHLCQALSDNNCHVRALTRKTSDLRYLKNANVELRYGDIRDEDSLKGAVDGVDIVFHCAGLTKAKNKQDFYRVNHQGVINILNAAVNSNGNRKKFIYVSSQAAAGPGKGWEPIREEYPPNPVTTYGASKLAGEKELIKSTDEIPWVILRPPGIYGPRDAEIFTFFKAASIGIKPRFGKGKAVLSLVYIRDLVRGIIQSAFSDKSLFNTYFLTDGEVYNWDDLTSILLSTFNKRGIPVNIPIPLFHFLGSVSEKLMKIIGKTPMLTREKAMELTRENWACSCEKAMGDFNYSPMIKFPEGAQLTAKWYKENEWL